MSAKAAAVADILNELSRRGLGPTMAALGVEALGEIEIALEAIVDRHMNSGDVAPPTVSEEPPLERSYLVLQPGKNADAFVIVYRGRLSFRFGPLGPQEAATILDQCVQEHIPAFMSLDCGPEFDWEFVRDLRGHPEPEEPTPTEEGAAHP